MNNPKKYLGNYLGIVVANNDPSHAGRVKVFVPHISPNVYDKWNQYTQDKKFKFLGKNINSDLNDVIEDLKDILPWAECASPLAGETSSGRYNSYDKQASISDSNNYETTKPIEGFKATKYSQNDDGTGEKPANIYEKYNFSLNDAFAAPATSGVNKGNAYGTSYKPASYSNKPKGSFTIPAVGAHVWIFFAEGDPLSPVYFASSHGSQEWQSVYEVADYPDSYENKKRDDSNNIKKTEEKDHNIEIYRNKYLINQKGGTLEFVNTDNRESIKLTHYSGSSLQFTNNTTIHLATANDQSLILGDRFTTIRGSENFYTDGDYDNVIKGDLYHKIGSLDSGVMLQWKTIVQKIADIKQRFEIQRVKELSMFNSIQQKQSGNYGPCPVCSNNRKYYTLQNQAFGGAGVPVVRSGRDGVAEYDTIDVKGIQPPGDARSLAYPPTNRCPVCNNTGKSTSSMGGRWNADPMKKQLASLINAQVAGIASIEAKLNLGGHHVIDVTKHKFETIGLLMNDFGSVRVDSLGKMYNSAVLVDDGGVYENQEPSPLIEYVHVDDLPGGNYTLNVCNRYTMQVGAGGISLKTFGPVQIGGTIVNVTGEQVNVSSDNEVNIDGGKRLTLTADILVLKQRQIQQVMVDSSLGISRNLIVGGGAHIEGELTVNHVTAPVEIQETEDTKVYGVTNDETAKIIGYVQPGVTVCSNWGIVWSKTPCGDVAQPDCLYTYPHSHHFRNLPLNLVADNSELRKAGKANNSTDRNSADPQNNSKKGP